MHLSDRKFIQAGVLLFVIVAGLSLFTDANAATNLSVWAYPGASGRLIHQPDALGNRVVDTADVGYKAGLVPLPSTNVIPVKTNVVPVAGDNTAHIQAAINYVQGLPLDTNGFRGAVLLTAGDYPCSGTIKITASGVVLRGVGSFTNGSGTVLRATATNQYTLVQLTGSGSASQSTTHVITNQYVPVGARSFNVDSTSGFAVGDHVYIQRNTTTNWIHDIGMDLLTNVWTPGGYTLKMDRTITRIEGNRIFVDAPVNCALDRYYTNATLIKYTWSSRITNSGIESIFGKSDYSGSSTDENHGWVFVQFNSIENGWARDLACQYFGYACVALYSGTKHVTVDSCRSLDPISVITGGRRYAFVMDDDVLCLVKNCYTRQDRHQFVTQSTTMGPNVFVDGLSDSAHAEAGPHHRWATAGIWDNVTVNGHDLDVQNTCESGSGHGWEGANCAIWNSKANSLKVARPPTANNWLIGSIGSVSVGGSCHGISSQAGSWDSSGSGDRNVFPDSLYFADLQNRLAEPKLQPREYWLGIISAFTNTSPRDAVALDTTWSNSVKTIAGGQPLDGFDVVTNNHWIPFTFNFNISSNEHVVAATLSLAMRASSSANGDVLYFGSTNNALAFSSLGWLPVGTGTNTTVRVMDLVNQLNQLTNGQFNVAVQGDAGIDWALLELQVAPSASTFSTTLTPVADATVRGGSSAGNNFGTATTLTVRQDTSANNLQQAYLRWDLSGIVGGVYQARVVLTPLSAGTNNCEQGVAVASSNNWTEAGVTWNSQPNGGERFASWIPSTNGTVSLDVTPQVLEAMTGDKQLSLQLFSIRTNTVDYASRENVNSASRPQLIITQLGSAPGISDIADQSIAPNTVAGPIAFTIGGPSVGSLTVSGSSSNQGLVPDANIVFGGSGTNRTVTLTPLANQSGIATITVTVSDPGGLSASDAFTLTVSSHSPTTLTWNGPGAGTNNWSVAGNWSPAFAPEYADNLKFFDAGAAGVAVSNINNYVNFDTAVASLQYGNTNGNHTTLIGAGKTLTVSGAGGLVVGTETDNGQLQAVFTTITGNGGTLSLANGSADLVIRQGSATNNVQRATLDLSGLGELDATLDQILVGVAGPVNRPVGTLYLARTNNLTLSGSPGIEVADSSSNGGNQSLIHLGLNNQIFADTITIGRQKSSGLLDFNPAFTNSSPTLYLRGASDDRVAVFAVGDNSPQSASGSASAGAVDLGNYGVDAMADVVYLGKGQTAGGTGGATGTFTFSAGTFDVNTLEAGYGNSSTPGSVVTGTLNVNGTATLTVNSSLRLARSLNTASNLPVGNLNIRGGTVAGAGNILAGGGTSTLTASNGTIAITAIGSAAAPITRVALTNSTLRFPVAAGLTNLAATTLVAGGSSNVVDITSLPGGNGQYPLITYSGVIGGAGYDFVLMPLPAGASGYLSNNAANASVDLVVTSFIVPDPFLTWNGDASGDWDTDTANWKNNGVGGLLYAEGNDVVFNDSAAGTTIVNLTETLTPNSLTISNNAKLYIFDDVGSLSGSMALVKQGTNALIIANSGSNDFTGSVSINGGTVTVGDGAVNGNLPPAVSVANNAGLAFNHSDTMVVPNVISGSGTLTQAGSGVLVLAVTNPFTGAVTFNNGVISVPAVTDGGVAGPLGASSAGTTNLVFDGGALRWTAGASGSMNRGFLLTTNGGTLDSSPTISANLTLSGIVGFSGNGNRTLTLAGVDPNPLLIGGNSFNSIISNAPSGITTVVKNGNNAWNLSGANTYSGGTFVNGGRYRANTSASAFGTGPVTVADGGQAYLNVGATFANAFFISGKGILEWPSVNEFTNSFGAMRLASNGATVTNTVTLAGDARISARSATGTGGVISGKVTGNYSIEFGNGGGTGSSGSGNGILTLSNPANDWSGDTLISHGVVKGGVANVIPNGAGKGNVILNGSGALLLGNVESIFDLNGFNQSVNGLSSSNTAALCVITNGTGAATLTVGNNNATSTFGGIIKGGAGTIALTKTGGGTFTLSGANTYTGNTTVSNGTLSVSGSLGNSAVTVSGGTIAGTGTLGGSLTVNFGGTVAPGVPQSAVVGRLTVSGATTLRGTTQMKLNKTAATNDSLQVGSGVSFGGTLALTNLSGTLAVNDSFRLFNAATYSGAFTNIVPAVPGPGLKWDTSTLTVNGTLKVATAPRPSIAGVSISGNSLAISGTNGQAGETYWILASTNVTLPLANWPVIATNVFDPNGNFSITNAVNPSVSQTFYLLQLQ